MNPIRVTAVLAVLVVLAGCSPIGSASPSASADPDEVAVAAVRWEGNVGDPELVFNKPLRVSEPTIGVIDPGNGPTISMGQLVTFDSLVVDGETGVVEASTFGGDTPEQLILASNTANTTMLTAMRSARVGARFLYVTPSTETTTAPAATAGTSGAARVIAISIRSVTDLPAQAEGQPKRPNPGLPKVEIGSDGLPELIATASEPAAGLAAEVLIEGTGPQVGEGQTLAVKYRAWLWDGTAVEQAWGDVAPAVFSLNDVVSGWSKGIVGKNVGSRVLMVIPPELAYGGAGSDSIPPDSTLVFVVDVLAAY